MPKGPRNPRVAASFVAPLAAVFLHALTAISGASAADLDPGLLADLDAADLATRERATATLGAETTVAQLNRIQEALAEPDLSPEQRLRLRHAAQLVFDTLERPGLGVSFARVEANGPVEIAGTVENFPAHAVLQRGDRVIAIDGQVLESTSHMRWMILSHAPGDILEMDLIRTRNPADDNEDVEADAVQGPIEERLSVAVPLGRYGDLANGQQVARTDLRAALDIRLLGAGVVDHPAAGNRAVGTSITPKQWLTIEGLWPDFEDAALFASVDGERPVPANAARTAAVGGQPFAIDAETALLASDVPHRERLDNRRLAARDSLGPWENPVTLVRINARQIIDIDRRLHHGVGRVRRPVSLDGLRRERHQLTQGLVHAARAIDMLPPVADNQP
ncbi:MAG: PDZ domain-containing protein [Planctomycetota bacterium]